ncbi:hypothetical protein HDU96_007984 [Phlyctochytrium bullatum]|nr:hypothetical protein HDU96_007984 [Phlyctochytrium bullatum]
MCFIGFLAKIAVVVIAVKWFTKDKKRRETCAVRDGRTCVKVKWDEKDITHNVKEGIKKASEWISEYERRRGLNTPTPTPAATAAAAATSAVFPATPSTPPAYTITDFTTEESASSFAIHIDVPGFRRDEIAVTVLDLEREVVVTGDSKERGRKVDVRVKVPRACELGRVAARTGLGVLVVEVPKSEFEGRKVEVAGPTGEKAASEEGWEKAF